MKTIKFLFLLLLFISHFQVECQVLEYTPPYCPYDQGDFRSWRHQSIVGVGEQAFDKMDYRTITQGDVGDVFYKRINGQLNVAVDESSWNGYFSFDDIFGYFISTIIIKHASYFGNEDFLCPYGDGSNFKEIAFNKRSVCKIKRKCYLKTNQSFSLLCAGPGWLPEHYNFLYKHFGGVKFLEVENEEQICGASCCKWIVKIDCNGGSGNANRIVSVIKENDDRACVESYYDCKTSQLIECGGYCE